MDHYRTSSQVASQRDSHYRVRREREHAHQNKYTRVVRGPPSLRPTADGRTPGSPLSERLAAASGQGKKGEVPSTGLGQPAHARSWSLNIRPLTERGVLGNLQVVARCQCMPAAAHSIRSTRTATGPAGCQSEWGPDGRRHRRRRAKTRLNVASRGGKWLNSLVISGTRPGLPW